MIMLRIFFLLILTFLNKEKKILELRSGFAKCVHEQAKILLEMEIPYFIHSLGGFLIVT